MDGKQKAHMWSARPKRVDRWVKERFPSLSRRHVLEAIEAGWVSYHDETEREHVMKKGDRVPPNNFLDCDRLENHINTTWEGNPKLQVSVLHQEKSFVVIDKPSGMPSAPIALEDFDTVTHWALAQYNDLAREFRGEFQPTITPHRLDTDTSGCLIVCLTRATLKEMRSLFEAKSVSKRYHAWCWGDPTESEYHTEISLAHHETDERRMVPVTEGTYREPILNAVTTIKVLEKKSGYFLCEAHCQTGATHQIRVHLAHLGFPLVGDALYDSKFSERKAKVTAHQLRASEIEFSGKKISAPLELFRQSPCA